MRGLLERTRGDLTIALVQRNLERRLEQFEGKDKIVSVVDLDAPTVEERVKKHLKERKAKSEKK